MHSLDLSEVPKDKTRKDLLFIREQKEKINKSNQCNVNLPEKGKVYTTTTCFYAKEKNVYKTKAGKI